MKKIIIILLVSLGLSSCNRELVTLVTYYYDNKSGADIIISDLYVGKEIASIDNGTVYKISLGADAGAFPLPFNTGNIEVIFNGNRSIKYAFDVEIENNPLSLKSYRVVTIKEDKCSKTYIYEYHYTFTEKQYQDAEPYVPGK